MLFPLSVLNGSISLLDPLFVQGVFCFCFFFFPFIFFRGGETSLHGWDAFGEPKRGLPGPRGAAHHRHSVGGLLEPIHGHSDSSQMRDWASSSESWLELSPNVFWVGGWVPLV